MNSEEYRDWIKDNGTGEIENVYLNGIEWRFVMMNDGWIAVFQYDGYYIPKFQAKDREHAISRCNMYEMPQIALNVI